MSEIADFCQAVSRAQFRGCSGGGSGPSIGVGLPDEAPTQVPDEWPEFEKKVTLSSGDVPLEGYVFGPDGENAVVYPIPGIPGLVFNDASRHGQLLWIFFTDDGDWLPVAFHQETGEGFIPKRVEDGFDHAAGRKIPVRRDEEGGFVVTAE